MKALYTLIVLVLLTGCSSYLSSLISGQSVDSDAPQAKDVKIASVDKNNADKEKILTPVHMDILPPLSTTASIPNGNISIPSITPKVEAKKPVDPDQFSPSKIFKVGSRGDEVLAMEKRLNELHYDVGIVDGIYDQQTRQGVVAFQKYSQLNRTGTYTLETQKALLLASPPEGLHPELGLPRVEIDITRQVLLFFDAQGLNSVIPVSTGSNRKYCEISKKSGKEVCGVARTPRGQFSIQSRISGWRESDLGKLYNPLYFNGGFAIHGSPSVPDHNVSHGCVRIPIPSAIWFYHAVQNSTPVILFD
jgi:peptidoglycan hydrolase-like protein with peptidoglycan-binding domain